MSQNQNELVTALAIEARDTTQLVERRRQALRHLCQLRGEPTGLVDVVAEDDINAVVAGMVHWPSGVEPLSIADTLETIREGRTRRGSEHRRR